MPHHLDNDSGLVCWLLAIADRFSLSFFSGCGQSSHYIINRATLVNAGGCLLLNTRGPDEAPVVTEQSKAGPDKHFGLSG